MPTERTNVCGKDMKKSRGTLEKGAYFRTGSQEDREPVEVFGNAQQDFPCAEVCIQGLRS